MKKDAKNKWSEITKELTPVILFLSSIGLVVFGNVIENKTSKISSFTAATAALTSGVILKIKNDNANEKKEQEELRKKIMRKKTINYV